MSALDELRELFPPPSERPPVYDWREAERQLGSPLPEDYKGLLDTYGAGSFDDFLWVLQPGGANRYLDLIEQAQRQLDALRDLKKADVPIPYEVSAEDAELLPWGITDNGDVCYWITRPRESPDRWQVVINESRGPEWEIYDGTVTEYLVALFSRRVQSAIFPDDVPSDAPEFIRPPA